MCVNTTNGRVTSRLLRTFDCRIYEGKKNIYIFRPARLVVADRAVSMSKRHRKFGRAAAGKACSHGNPNSRRARKWVVLKY